MENLRVRFRRLVVRFRVRKRTFESIAPPNIPQNMIQVFLPVYSTIGQRQFITTQCSRYRLPTASRAGLLRKPRSSNGRGPPLVFRSHGIPWQTFSRSEKQAKKRRVARQGIRAGLPARLYNRLFLRPPEGIADA